MWMYGGTDPLQYCLFCGSFVFLSWNFLQLDFGIPHTNAIATALRMCARFKSRKGLLAFIPVPGGPVRKTSGGDLCIRSSCWGIRTRYDSLRPSSATASPTVRTSTRGGTLQCTLTEVAGPTNLSKRRQLMCPLCVFMFVCLFECVRARKGVGGPAE